MKKALFVYIFTMFLASGSTAQPEDCLNYNEASEDPVNAKCLSIDCFNDDCNAFFNTLDEYANMAYLEVINCDRDYFPRDMSMITKLTSLTITQSPNLNFTSLMRKLAALPALKTLTLDNNGIKTLPKTIVLIQTLDTLSVRNNENFDIEGSIPLLTHLPGLRCLALPVNQISDLPENISLLKNLEMLDLSDNQLTDLPKNISKMDSLHVLNIEKNIFINPVKTLEKLKGLNIKYLSFDPVISGKDKEKLLKIFPKAKIIEVVDTLETEEYETADEEIMDADTLSEDEYEESRTIQITGEKFQVLSDAYLHYPIIFDRENFKNTFDSSLFEERYLDTTYSNIWKIQPWRNYNHINIYLFRDGERGEIWFDFHRETKKGIHITQYIAKNNPEVMSFLGYKWVYQGKLTKREFIREYINTPDGRRYWHDMRIYYNDAQKNFTIELKDKVGFTLITASLRARSTITSLEKSQEVYTSFFDRYSKSLDARRKRFQKRLFKDKSSYDVTLQRSLAGAWEGFKRIYMSPEERRMGMKKWLDYYDKVLADESQALLNAAPTPTLLARSFELSGYTPNKTPVPSDTNLVKGVYSSFCDENKNMAAVIKIIVVDLTNKSFREYEGSLGLKSIKLYFRVETKYAVIVEFRNGDIGIIRAEKFGGFNMHHNMDHLFMAERIPVKISTIGQIKDMIGM